MYQLSARPAARQTSRFCVRRLEVVFGPAVYFCVEVSFPGR